MRYWWKAKQLWCQWFGHSWRPMFGDAGEYCGRCAATRNVDWLKLQLAKSRLMRDMLDVMITNYGKKV